MHFVRNWAHDPLGRNRLRGAHNSPADRYQRIMKSLRSMQKLRELSVLQAVTTYGGCSLLYVAKKKYMQRNGSSLVLGFPLFLIGYAPAAEPIAIDLWRG